MKINDQTYPAKSFGHFPRGRVFYAGLLKSIAMMALGYISVKFAFLVIQTNSVSAHKVALVPAKTYAGDFGILLVAIGLCSACSAYYQYCLRERQGKKGAFSPTPLPALFLTTGVLVLGLFLFNELLQGL